MKRKVAESSTGQGPQETGPMRLENYQVLTDDTIDEATCAPICEEKDIRFHMFVEMVDNHPSLLDRFNIVLPEVPKQWRLHVA